MSKLKKSDYINDFISKIESRNETLLAKRDALSIDQFENENELKKAIKSENSRINENNMLKVALQTDDLSSVFYAHNIKADELLTAKYANTREFKKRFLSIIRAIASNDREKLLDCDDLVFSAISAKRIKASDLTLSKIMSVMSHKSKTQASYLANLCSYLSFADKHKDSSEQACITFKTDSAFFKKIMSLYA